jgi:hypothetical protein
MQILLKKEEQEKKEISGKLNLGLNLIVKHEECK